MHLQCLLLGWPCHWARLSGKGGPSLGDSFLLCLGLSLSELHFGALDLLVLALCLGLVLQYLFLCMCTVWATDPGFVAPIEAPGPAPNALLSVVEVGPNKCIGRVAEGVGPLRSSLLLH